jgi:uncharacterized membrane protein YgcG
MTRTTTSRERSLLLEKGDRLGYALTPDGRFLRVQLRPGDEEGREIVVGSRATAPRASHLRFRLRPGLATALVLALCLVVLSPFAVGRVLASGAPVAFVTLDASPSLELGVNRWDRVVSAHGLNAQGEKLLVGLTWRGRRVSDVVSAVGEATVRGGLLPAGKSDILVAVVSAREGSGIPPGLERQLPGIGEQLALAIEAEDDDDDCEVTVEIVCADSAIVRAEADRLGLSVGRYAVLLAAQEAGLTIQSGDLERGVGEAILGAGGRPGEILSAAHENREMSKLAEKFHERNGLDLKEEDDSDKGDGEPGDGSGSGSEAGSEQGSSGQGGGDQQGGTGSSEHHDHGGLSGSGQRPGRGPGTAGSDGHGHDGETGPDSGDGQDAGEGEDEEEPGQTSEGQNPEPGSGEGSGGGE